MSDVKLKKDGTPKKKTGPKTSQGKAKQAKTQFKKGNPTPNPEGARVNFRKPTIAMRHKMHELLQTAGLPMLVNILYDSYESKDRKDILGIIEFMFKYAYGTPREMHDYEELEKDNSQPANTPVIMVSREDLLKGIEDDKLYE